jgi:hypothetical protein
LIYVINSIRDREKGAPREREARRKGHRVEIAQLNEGAPMTLIYVDDGGKTLTTSTVVTHGVDPDGSYGDYLVVITRNSVYTFLKEAEVAL